MMDDSAIDLMLKEDESESQGCIQPIMKQLNQKKQMVINTSSAASNNESELMFDCMDDNEDA